MNIIINIYDISLNDFLTFLSFLKGTSKINIKLENCIIDSFNNFDFDNSNVKVKFDI